MSRQMLHVNCHTCVDMRMRKGSATVQVYEWSWWKLCAQYRRTSASTTKVGQMSSSFRDIGTAFSLHMLKHFASK